MSRILKSLIELVKRRDVAFALAKATMEHRQVEEAYKRTALRVLRRPDGLEFPHLCLSPLQYFQRNFFSILFLSIYEAIGVCKERRLGYGTITHAIRGIVTAVDNVLDGQDQGPVRLRLQGGNVLPNVLLALLHDGIAHQAIAELARNEAARRRTWEAVINALHDIAHEESGEEALVKVVLSPEEVLSTIHQFRGGRLLELAFVAPQVNEPQFAEPIERARHGVNRIGLGLQALDDVTDFAEDIERRNHNLLRSWIVHRAPDGPATDEALARMRPPDLAAPERCFPQATARVLHLAFGLITEGFDSLHRLGHAVDREAVPELAKIMFRLRGLSHLWDFYEESVATNCQVNSLQWAPPKADLLGRARRA